MKLPIGWLNEYVSTKGVTPEELADKLLNIGFEVEEIIRLGQDIDRVVVGKITEIRKHPDADKLQICRVDVGKEVVTLVTGAQNVHEGDYVPVALDGAALPGGKVIRSGPLRGVMSCGMLCSGAELGVDDSVIAGAEVHGILLLPPTELGKDIREVLRLNETILDVSVTANRPDCQSIYGMAREVSAVLGRKCKPLDLQYTSAPSAATPSVKVTDAACPAYTCRVIENVHIAPSPEWMRDRLRYAGLRPINNVVDITNYVLLEVGQPLHAFDTKCVHDLGIVVRKATEGEKIVALDGKEYTLHAGMTVIADNEKPLAIAGVMGGEHSGISPQTTSVLLEAARFAKGSIRSASRTLGLRSDSSARYEKGVDAWSVDAGRERALALFDKLCAGTVTDAGASAGTPVGASKAIDTSVDRINALLGICVKRRDVTKILTSLGFGVTGKGKTLHVEIPPYREDVDNYTDLAEEVIRFYGYDNIRSTMMPSASVTAGGADTRLQNLDAVKALACDFGAHEITTFAFYGKKACDKLLIPADSALRRHIRILNPLSEEYSLMRTQLVSHMLQVVSYNLSKKNDDFRLYEVSKTFLPKALPLTELPEEHDCLCAAFVGRDEDFYAVKRLATTVLEHFAVEADKIEYSQAPYLHPGVSCDIYVGGKVIASVGKLHPIVAKNYDISQDVYLCHIDMADFIGKEIPITRFVPLPKYQAVERDLAVVVDRELPVGNLLQTARAAHPLVTDVQLLDVYTGEQIEAGKKSVALSLKLCHADKTLSDEEINAAMQDILAALRQTCGAELR